MTLMICLYWTLIAVVNLSLVPQHRCTRGSHLVKSRDDPRTDLSSRYTNGPHSWMNCPASVGVGVSIVGGKFRTTEAVDTSPKSLNRFFMEGRLMPRISLDLTPEQRDEADRIKLRLMAVVEDEIQGIAELLASKPDRQILGQAEFQVRDRVHSIGARAIETALDERKKGATKVPAPPARPAEVPASSSAARTARSLE